MVVARQRASGVEKQRLKQVPIAVLVVNCLVLVLLQPLGTVVGLHVRFMPKVRKRGCEREQSYGGSLVKPDPIGAAFKQPDWVFDFFYQ